MEDGKKKGHFSESRERLEHFVFPTACSAALTKKKIKNKQKTAHTKFITRSSSNKNTSIQKKSGKKKMDHVSTLLAS